MIKKIMPPSLLRCSLVLLCICLIALSSIQCGKGKDNRAYSRDSTITIAYPAADWKYRFIDDSTQFLVFLPLVARNTQGELEGRLAERWEHSADYSTWIIHLRQGVRWHDGVPVTAHDVKFTLDLLSDPDVMYAQPGGFTVTVLDDTTYTIEYHHLLADEIGKGSPLDDFTVYYPKHLLQQLDPEDFGDWKFWSDPVGNGPYRHVRQVPQTVMVFEANPDYYRGKPPIERVVLKYTNEEGIELFSSNVDAVSYVSRKFLLMLPGNVRYRAYHEINSNHNRVVAWNLHNDLFRDATVRRALTLAIDRIELHQVLSIPADVPVFDVPLSRRQFRRGDMPESLPYDPERAKRLLHEAGWRDENGNGLRNHNGRLFRFTLLTTGFFQGDAVYIQSQLRRIGILVDIQTMDFSVVRERVTASQFEAALFVANASLDSPYGVLPFFGEESFIGYANSEVIALLNELKITLDPDEIDRIHRQLAPIFQVDLPVTFLYPYIETVVASRRVRGLSTPYRADILQYMEDLWLEEEKP